MKLKLILVVVFAAGFAASLALASSQKGRDPSTTTGTTTTKKPKCAQVELKGEATSGSLTFTVRKANKSGAKLVGTQVTLSATSGDKVKAKACTTAGSNALTLFELHVEHRQKK